jgi:pimeloyl-ACP methyl ester carboxylesterase
MRLLHLPRDHEETSRLHGDRDGCIDVALVADAQRHLAPDSRMEVIKGVGHFLHLERPGAVNERILAWILS